MTQKELDEEAKLHDGSALFVLPLVFLMLYIFVVLVLSGGK